MDTPTVDVLLTGCGDVNGTAPGVDGPPPALATGFDAFDDVVAGDSSRATRPPGTTTTTSNDTQDGTNSTGGDDAQVSQGPDGLNMDNDTPAAGTDAGSGWTTAAVVVLGALVVLAACALFVGIAGAVAARKRAHVKKLRREEDEAAQKASQ